MAYVSSSNMPKYDVFLSFRGQDIPDNFISHLKAELQRNSIETFMDGELTRGEQITTPILQAIEESKIAVTIFSKDFASSTWCLDEVAKIIECNEVRGQIVVPIFYHVDPFAVAKQTGSFEEAFAQHQINKSKEDLLRWKNALSKAANMTGWDSKVIRPESRLDDIVMYILTKLKEGSRSDVGSLVGIKTDIEKIKKLLCIDPTGIHVVGIWGMGGMGKTTLAEAVFNQIAYQFDGWCFLANVREKFEKYGGSTSLKEELLSKLLAEGDLKINTPKIGYSSAVKMLSHKKVLIVLDDVDSSEQLDLLLGNHDWLGVGSGIIVTSRDRQVLGKGVDVIHEVKELGHHEALLLFSQNAFKSSNDSLEKKKYYNLSCSILEYTKGVPLALKVLGSFLFGRSEREWQSTLDKLKRFPNKNIQNVLKTSYDGLDEEEKSIFLDIACFFRGATEERVTKILDGCGFSTDIGLRVLIDKSLITISNKRIEMHGLLQEMGKEIVRQESKEPGKRSRLWNHEDIRCVLTKNKGTEATEGIFLDTSKISKMELNSNAFERMSNIKFLKFYRSDIYDGFEESSKMKLPQGLESLPDELRFFYWDGYPLKSLPANFCFENLIVLELPHSRVEQLCTGDEVFLSHQNLEKLKEIDLSYSLGLTILPELSKARNLTSMKLSGCKNIKSLPSSIECLHRLHLLELNYCTNLESLPSNICKLKSLKTLSLQGCSNLQIFPEIVETMDDLKVLVLNETAIKELPSSIEHLKGLTSIYLENCQNLSHLPESFCNLTSLYQIFLSCCPKLKKLPERFSNLSILEELTAVRCTLLKFPSDFNHLSSISKLDLNGNNLEQLPASLKELSCLQWLDISSCRALQFIQELPQSLKNIDAHDCTSLETISGLEQLLQSKYADSYYYESFIFTNCFKVDRNAWRNILSNVKRRIRELAMRVNALWICEAPMTAIDEVLESFCIWYPGTEIPEWFADQGEGSLISIHLDPPSHNSLLLGFALCVVISFQHKFEYHNSFFDVRCRYSFKNYSGHCLEEEELYSNRSHVSGNFKYVSEEHLVLFYDPNFCATKANEVPFSEASFEFYLQSNESTCSKSCKVEKCAVFPLYAEKDEKGNRVEASTKIMTDFMEEEAVKIKRCWDRSGSFNEEEKEYYPKGLKQKKGVFEHSCLPPSKNAEKKRNHEDICCVLTKDRRASPSFTSPSDPKKQKYDVFLSFRGEDTRHNFASHLYSALRRQPIETFVDEDGLNRGDEITPSVMRVIEESKISVIIFSKDYASSTFCLDEVAKIMECHETHGQIVLPIFHYVNPSDVREQMGRFEIAFSKHYENHNSGKVEKWKYALSRAANISGLDSNSIGSESKLVDITVEFISKKLEQVFYCEVEGLVGINSGIQNIMDLLSIYNPSQVRYLGIWGTRGIGKTTLAEAVFHRIADQFEGSCFLANVRERSKNYHELRVLCKELLSQTLELEEGKVNIITPNIGYSYYVRQMLSRKRVLIVLDDVNSQDQLNSLAGDPSWFGAGSRIIVTSRDKHVLKPSCDDIYEVEELDYHQALKLFNLHAFKKTNPTQTQSSLSELFVKCADGIPLALKVWGSFLNGLNDQEWEKVWQKLKKKPPKGIQSVLGLSYDSLDLVQEMGQGIVREESKNQLGKRSILWDRVSNELDSCLSFGFQVMFLWQWVVPVCIGALVMVAARGIWAPLFSHDKGIIISVNMMILIMALPEVINFPLTVCGGIVRGIARPWLGTYASLGGFYLLALPVAVLLAFTARFLVGTTAALALLLTFILLRLDWEIEANKAQKRAGYAQETIEGGNQRCRETIDENAV